MKPVIVHPPALAELSEAVVWYEAHDSRVALDLLVEVDAILIRISESPAQFPVWQDNRRFRKAVLPATFPFIIFYRELDDHVEVLAVSHGAREPGYWLPRAL